MDQARKLPWEERESGQRARQESLRVGLAELDKVLRFPPGQREAAPEGWDRGPSRRDWSSALDMVHHAAEAIRATEDRARTLEERAQELMQRASEEIEAAQMRLQAAEARIMSAEARAEEAEARARDAEGRARDAEEWLKRLHDAIVHEFSAQRKAGPERTEG